MILYVIGSLGNPKIPSIAQRFRDDGHDVYDEWHCPGPEADQHWQEYCKNRGLTYEQALDGWHGKQVYEIDKFHLDRADAAVLVYPAGRSGHLEAGYLIGKGKPVYLLLNGQPDRYDIMTRMLTKVTCEIEEIAGWLQPTPVFLPMPQPVSTLSAPHDTQLGGWRTITECSCVVKKGTK